MYTGKGSYEGTYLSKIWEQALLRQIERYRDACPFKVEMIIHSDGVLRNVPAVRITTEDTIMRIFYKSRRAKEQIRKLLSMIDPGPEGVYVWKPLEYQVETPFNPMRGYKPEKWGKWVEIPGRPGEKPMLVLPWCYELRDALVRAVV